MERLVEKIRTLSSATSKNDTCATCKANEEVHLHPWGCASVRLGTR